MPVVVLMSDGAPTLGSSSFTNPETDNLGDGQTPGDNEGARLAFVTQLTAAYAKSQIEAKYGKECLFYTLGLGVGDSASAISVLNPAESSTSVNNFWRNYNNAEVGDKILVKDYVIFFPDVYVTKINTTLEQNYVDKYFPVNTTSSDMAADLKQAFRDIVSEIKLQSSYYPTLVTGNEDVSGYISFVDKIGDYMSVTDVKGILINNVLHTGALLSENFVEGGGKLGAFDSPTELGNELIWAVQQRLNIPDIDTARTLVQLAYNYGQLSYTDENNFSNYIGWYGDAQDNFLGFWHEDIDPAHMPAGAKYITKSYGYLGETDETLGVKDSDMMYTVVHVRENIETGEESVAFAVPAALLPIVTYDVELSESGELLDLSVSGAQHPIRLVYEVALDDNINEINFKNVVSSDYLANNTNADGSVNFYTNKFEKDNSVGYGLSNTYSYFTPSRENERYYFIKDALVYSNTNGDLFTGTAFSDSTVYYQQYDVYEKKADNSLEITKKYRVLSSNALEYAKRDNTTGTWTVPAGAVHLSHSDYEVLKADNTITSTLQWVSKPFVDIYGHTINEPNYNYYVGSTLGNNAKLVLTPATGIKISKTVSEINTLAPNAPEFEFVISSSQETNNKTYDAIFENALGVQRDTTVSFTDGKATVKLKDGESIYILGMTEGYTYNITEKYNAYYSVYSVNGNSALKEANITTVKNSMVATEFVNAPKGSGNLTITKLVQDNLDGSASYPVDKKFTMVVEFAQADMEGKNLTVSHSGDVTLTTLKVTDGKISFTLGNGEQLEIANLPEDVSATVTEVTPGTGFKSVSYIDDSGVTTDGKVLIGNNGTVSVVVINNYEPLSVSPTNVNVSGTKIFQTENTWDTETFKVILQKNVNGAWVEMATETIDKDNTSYDFSDIIHTEVYDTHGTYSYQILEEFGGTTVDGIVYDPTKHTFSIIVGDSDFDGQLEVQRVIYANTNTDVIKVGETFTKNDFDFTNRYTATDTILGINVFKTLKNDSKSPLAIPFGYQFGLYTDADATDLIATSNFTDGEGEAQFLLEFSSSQAREEDYVFYVKEIKGNDPHITYTNVVYKITINVSTSGGYTFANVTSISLYKNEDGDIVDEAADELRFTNTYTPTTANLTIDVEKQLTGRTLRDGEFEFGIYPLDSEEAYTTGKNDANGKVNFDKPLTFNEVGEFDFYVKEISEDGNGVTTDKTVHYIHVTVTDNDGQLNATYTVIDAIENKIVFKNTYKASGVDFTVEGHKNLTGKTLLNEEFTFLLSELDDNNEIVSGSTKTATNDLDGKFTFEKLTFTEAGTYKFVISESVPEITYGIAYDPVKYLLTLVVTDNQTLGVLEVEDTVEILEGESETPLTFTNRYSATKTTAQITGDKILTGMDLKEGQFSFELYEASNDGKWNKEDLVESVENELDGTFNFTTIEYTAAGTYYYLVCEVNGGKIIDGITYDGTVYRVKVIVIDNLKGELISRVEIFDQNDIPFEVIEFENVYDITAGTTLDIEGEKTLTGRDIVDGEFTFELYTSNSEFTGLENLVTKVNSNDKFNFTLTYTAEDLETERFYYVLREKNFGEKIDGVTYDDSVYYITIVVKDNGKGGIIAEFESIIKDEDSVEKIEFTNVYVEDTPPPTPPSPPDVPDTGSKTNLYLWMILLFVSSFGFIKINSITKKKELGE